jgi:outer membrane protein assembly factor BamA
MTKLRLLIPILVFLLQALHLPAQNSYRLYVRCVDKDSAFLVNSGIPEGFSSRSACTEYVNQLPTYLRSRGYVTASLDSIQYDSASARLVLFAGEVYKWARIDVSQVDPTILHEVGWREKLFEEKPMDFSNIRIWQDKILNYLENNGYPFAKVYLDSLQMGIQTAVLVSPNDANEAGQVSARLRVDKGPLYTIDSIRVFGTARISNDYLQRYLDIRNGSTFSKEKLLRISKRMKELTYVQEDHPAKLIWLGSGSFLEMYLKQKKSSQVNVIVGFLPNNDQLASQKLLVTGEANIKLKNAFGNGETIGLNWQQLQVKSPRLNIIYQHPYLFHSPFGLDFSFDMLRKDSSYVNINIQLGAQYILNIHQSGQLFIHSFQSIVNGVNTNYVLLTHQLPPEADVSSLNAGIDYDFNNANYRLNPTSGNEFHLTISGGSKNIKKNSQILDLKDPGDPGFDFNSLYDTIKMRTYQLRTRITAAKYIPIGGQRSTIKTAVNAGFYQSGNIFRNELFQIGGYKLLRGFDEESQYLSQFVIGTLEYHYLLDQNSYFYVLADGGWGRNNSQNMNVNYTYFGTGLGLALETKVGIFNLAWAVGKRNDTEFNLRQSKIHFGFVNYF